MKILRRVTSEISYEVEGQDVNELFAQMASIEEILGHDTCGHCGEKKVRICHRRNQGFDFYSIACLSCKYQLEFGKRREDGGLFPRRKDNNGNWLPDGGWVPPYSGGQGQQRDEYNQDQRAAGNHHHVNDQARQQRSQPQGNSQGDFWN